MTVERKSALRQPFFLLPLSLLIVLLLLSFEPAWAVDPKQPADRYLRTRFSSEQGLPSNLVSDLVQSQEGFLWLLVEGNDLARFDGRHFNRFGGLGAVTALAIAPNGDLWVGTKDDLKQIPAAALNQLGSLPAISYRLGPGVGSPITTLRFTRNGLLWVGTPGGLYRFEHGSFSLAIPGAEILRIEEAANGHLWVTTTEGPLEWDGARAVSHLELGIQLGVKSSEIYHVFEDSHGVTWLCTKNGVARRSGGTLERLAPYGPQDNEVFRVYEDPLGRIWAAKAKGLFRATASGLELVAADIQVRNMYGDRNGNLWAGTNGDGLYRFKERGVRMFTTADGLPNNIAMTVLAAHDGAVWTGFNCGGITRFDGKHFQLYNKKNGLLNDCVWTLAEDANHDLWIGTWGGGAFRLHQGKFTQYSTSQGLPSDVVFSVLPARDGSVWFVVRRKGVVRMQDGRLHNYTVADGLISAVNRRVYEDRMSGIWVQSAPSGTARWAGNRFVSSPFFAKVELGPIGEDRNGGLYFMVGSPRGIFRVANDQPIQVASDFVAEELRETEKGDLWVLSVDGIFRVPPGGLEHARPQDEPLDLESFGPADGLAATQPSGGSPASALTPDGKLWIATNQGLAVLDLSRLPRTDRKPATYMEEITVGRNSQAPGQELVLPAGTHHVELNFDAIEISSPEKIHLQYRLDGVDSEWLDAKPPGHAIYSTLSPGTHAFHVRACNRSGIWDRVGMVYYVTQRPYLYQTRWFLAATIALGLLVIAGLYRLRVRQVAKSLSARFDERLAERSRIARELHDTLLQTFTASLLRFQSVLKMLPARPEEARQRVESVIEQASNAIAEGRDAVQQLRAAGSATVDLPQSISNLVRELASSSASEQPPEFRVQVEGTPRALNPMVRDEAYRIAGEALRNAIRHAGAGHIEVEIRYDEQHLRVRIRDDGKGIDPGLLEQGQAPGHWGLRGMRERARLLGGNLEVWSRSEAGSGTEVELTVPAASAYPKPASHWSISWRSRRK